MIEFYSATVNSETAYACHCAICGKESGPEGLCAECEEELNEEANSFATKLESLSRP